MKNFAAILIYYHGHTKKSQIFHENFWKNTAEILVHKLKSITKFHKNFKNSSKIRKIHQKISSEIAQKQTQKLQARSAK